jgi:hypothetical protein
MTKESALNEVAAELNVSPETLKSWETRLRKDFGRIRVDDAISTADLTLHLLSKLVRKHASLNVTWT